MCPQEPEDNFPNVVHEVYRWATGTKVNLIRSSGGQPVSIAGEAVEEVREKRRQKMKERLCRPANREHGEPQSQVYFAIFEVKNFYTSSRELWISTLLMS